jgi:hypothetical protein
MFLIVRPLQLFKGVRSGFGLLAAPKIVHTATHTDHNNEPQSHNWKIGRCVRCRSRSQTALRLRRTRKEYKRDSLCVFSLCAQFYIELCGIFTCCARGAIILKQEHANGLILALNKSRLSEWGKTLEKTAIEVLKLSIGKVFHFASPSWIAKVNWNKSDKN